MATTIEPTGLYLSIMDVWSNVEYVGPFADEAARLAYRDAQNQQFDMVPVDGRTIEKLNAEFGDAPVTKPH